MRPHHLAARLAPRRPDGRAARRGETGHGGDGQPERGARSRFTTTTTTTRSGSWRPGVAAEHDRYKWWALSGTSGGKLLATVNSGTLIIGLPGLERTLDTSRPPLAW